VIERPHTLRCHSADREALGGQIYEHVELVGPKALTTSTSAVSRAGLRRDHANHETAQPIRKLTQQAREQVARAQEVDVSERVGEHVEREMGRQQVEERSMPVPRHADARVLGFASKQLEYVVEHATPNETVRQHFADVPAARWPIDHDPCQQAKVDVIGQLGIATSANRGTCGPEYSEDHGSSSGNWLCE
jgi:hypothetical protein